jgi:hypothetical protein
MNCEKFEDVVADLARGEMMETYVRSTALSHLDNCARCSQRLHDEQALMRGLYALSVQMSSISASNEVETRLRESIRQLSFAPVVSLVRKPRRAYWLAVAAVLLLFVGAIVAINWQRQPRGNREAGVQPPAGVREPQKVDQPKENATIVVNNDERKVGKRNVRRPHSTGGSRPTRNEPEVVSNHAEEIATDFIPLGSINSGNLQDGGYIVRVELPRSALVKFGLPVNMDRLNENVKADVWLGVDGLAHAIRFVQ